MTEYVPLYRVQGGIKPNRSRKSIRVNKDKIDPSRRLSLYIGDKEHMVHFAQKRAGIYSKNPSSFPEDLEIITMYQPLWFSWLVENYAIKQFMSAKNNPDNKKTSAEIKLVDPLTPGSSYQVSGGWTNLLAFANIFATSVHIKNMKELTDAILYSHENFKLKQITYNIAELESILKECNVSDCDISKVKEMIKRMKTVKIIDYKEEKQVHSRAL